MSREHNKEGQKIIYDAETGKPIKFNDKGYDKLLDTIWVIKEIKPNYNLVTKI